MPRSIKAVVGALLAIGLCGCAGMDRGVEVSSRAEVSPASTDQAEAVPIARPDIKTVRPRGTPRPTARDTDAADAAEPAAAIVAASAVPSPQQIFDFHPAGSAPGSFRQPFIIDQDDGPLTADVRRTAAELKAFNSSLRPGTAIAGNKACGEDGVAHHERDCTEGGSRVASVASRDPLALK